jgi:beta-mannosidase
VLFWQLNDVWPAASWSSIDYLGRPKALQFHARRFYAPLLVAAIRDGGTTSVSLVSDLTDATPAQWRMRLFDFAGHLLREQQGDATLAPLASTPVATLTDAQLLQGADPRRSVAVFDLLVAGKVAATRLVWFDRAKALALVDPQVQATLATDGDGYRLSVDAASVARGVWIDFGNLEATVDDNAFDLLPGQPREVHVTSRASLGELRKALQVRSLYTATH